MERDITSNYRRDPRNSGSRWMHAYLRLNESVWLVTLPGLKSHRTDALRPQRRAVASPSSPTPLGGKCHALEPPRPRDDGLNDGRRLFTGKRVAGVWHHDHAHAVAEIVLQLISRVTRPKWVICSLQIEYARRAARPPGFSFRVEARGPLALGDILVPPFKPRRRIVAWSAVVELIPICDTVIWEMFTNALTL
jgi:hypothetical protein